LGSSPVSDNTLGSVLFYPVYTSNASSPETSDTRISITNADQQLSVNVHLFFIDGATCNVADNYICLTENQTATFLASEFDPGTTGFLIAIATNNVGCPTSFNALMGDVYVKFSSGHKANLAADAVMALNIPTLCDETSFMAQLNFNGVNYARLGRVLALSTIPDRASGNDTMLILNRIGGNLVVASATLGPIFGIAYNDVESPFGFNFNPNRCQIVNSISNDFPRTAPRIEQIIPAGRSGWIRLWTTDDTAIFGAMINFNPNSGVDPGAYTQGHNLHKLTLTSIGSLTIPLIPPPCD
jgi:hypothetical protein